MSHTTTQKPAKTPEQPSDDAQQPIPVLDLTPEIDQLWDELNAAFTRVMRSGQFIVPQHRA